MLVKVNRCNEIYATASKNARNSKDHDGNEQRNDEGKYYHIHYKRSLYYQHIPVLPEYEFIIIQYFQAGIMEEMMEDTMESLEPEDLEEDIQLEVDKILSELTADKSSKVKPGIKTQDSIRLPEVPGSSTIRDEEPAEEEEEVEEDLAEMQSRLQALRS